MQERPYDPDAVRELLAIADHIELHGEDGNHYTIQPKPVAWGTEFGGNRAAQRIHDYETQRQNERDLLAQINQGKRELLEARAALAPTKTYRVRYGSVGSTEVIEAHGYEKAGSFLGSAATTFYLYGERGRETVAEFHSVMSIVELDEECDCGPGEVCDNG